MGANGPFTTNVVTGTRRYHQEKYKWVGPGPRGVMPYVVSSTTASDPRHLLAAEIGLNLAFVTAGGLYERAYDRFWAQAQNRANIALTLMGGKQSLVMITARVRQLVGALRSLRRLDFVGVNRAFGVNRNFRPPSARVKSGVRDLSNSWLEYTFGWKPLVQDIFDAVNVLQQDHSGKPIRVTVRDVSFARHANDGGGYFFITGDCRYVMGGKIRVDNPNLHLANSLGLLNPAYVLWDAVPFSFVVDWFIPVGRFLRRMTNGAGITVIDPYRGAWCRTNGVSGYLVPFEDPPRWSVSGAGGYAGRRVVGVPPAPDFPSIGFPRVDPWLALTSLSLLAQQFDRLKR